MSEWTIGKPWPTCDPTLVMDGARVVANCTTVSDLKAIVRDHNATPKMKEALGTAIEVIQGAINIPDPTDEDRECFSRALVQVEAALKETDVVDDGTSAGEVKDD